MPFHVKTDKTVLRGFRRQLREREAGRRRGSRLLAPTLSNTVTSQ